MIEFLLALSMFLAGNFAAYQLGYHMGYRTGIARGIEATTRRIRGEEWDV